MRPDLIERVNDINISVISRLAQKSSIGKIMSLGTWIAGEKQKYFFFSSENAAGGQMWLRVRIELPFFHYI